MSKTPEIIEEHWNAQEVITTDKLQETETTWLFDAADPATIVMTHYPVGHEPTVWKLSREPFIASLDSSKPVCSPNNDVIVHRTENPLEPGTGTFDVYAMGVDVNEHDRRLHLRMPSRNLGIFLARTCIAVRQ